MKQPDTQTLMLFGGLGALLVVATIVGAVLRARVGDGPNKPTIDNINARIRAWWIMCAVFVVATWAGPLMNVLMFAAASFFALREFLTLTPTTRSDRVGMLLSFFVLLPLQYYWVATQWYGMFSIFLPVFGFLIVPMAAVLSNDYRDFLARTAKVQWGLLVCVYCVSYAPALLTLRVPGYDHPAKLLFFLVCVSQLSDVFQYICGKLFGKHKVAPEISPNKTVEGLVGGVICATAVGAGLYWATPFSPLVAAAMALMICMLGFFGGLTMSAIKRDRGVKDWGTAIEGHGGIMDRIDSLCFAAPVFFHATRYFFTP